MPDAPHRIVLCDDQPDYLRLLELLLELEPGLEIVGTAADGLEAIEACGRLRPDLLLLDVSMPNMDGITALPHIRAASPETVVVMLSGFSSSDVKRRALDAGAVVFLEKGTPMQEITRVAREHCPRPSTDRPLPTS